MNSVADLFEELRQLGPFDSCIIDPVSWIYEHLWALGGVTAHRVGGCN